MCVYLSRMSGNNNVSSVVSRTSKLRKTQKQNGDGVVEGSSKTSLKKDNAVPKNKGNDRSASTGKKNYKNNQWKNKSARKNRTPKQKKDGPVEYSYNTPHKHSDKYAWSSFQCSPHPSKLPLPSFFESKKGGLHDIAENSTANIEAAQHLKTMLGL